MAMAGAQMVLGVVQATTQFLGGQQEWSANMRAANLQYANTYNVAQQQGAQENVKQSNDTLQNTIDAARSFGRIAASAGSLGIGQSTSGAAIGAAGVEENRRQGIIDFNALSARNQIGNELQAANLRRTATINSVQKPSIMGVATSLLGSGLQSATTYYASGGKNLGGDVSSAWDNVFSSAGGTA